MDCGDEPVGRRFGIGGLRVYGLGVVECGVAEELGVPLGKDGAPGIPVVDEEDADAWVGDRGGVQWGCWSDFDELALEISPV